MSSMSGGRVAWGEGSFDPSLVGCWGAYGAEQNFRPPASSPKPMGGL